MAGQGSRGGGQIAQPQQGQFAAVPQLTNQGANPMRQGLGGFGPTRTPEELSKMTFSPLPSEPRQNLGPMPPQGGDSIFNRVDAMPAPMPAPPAAPMPASGMTPLAPTAGFNVNQASAGALQGALGGTQAAMTGPLQVGAYMNPYTQNVIDRTQQDIARQQEMAMNQLGAQATRARAFGGSRQGVAEGVAAGEFGRMAGDIAAQQRQTGYNTAMQQAMADRQARLGAASQLGALGQQAFGTGQAIQQQQMQQGLMQQMLQQSLIDAARGQYAGYTGAPQAALAAPLAALQQAPEQYTTTKQNQAGLFSYLQALTGMGAFN